MGNRYDTFILESNKRLVIFTGCQVFCFVTGMSEQSANSSPKNRRQSLMSITEESREGQEAERPVSLTLPSSTTNLRPGYSRYCSEYVSSDEKTTRKRIPAKQDLIQEMYLRSKHQYKQCISDVEQCVSDA